MSKTTFLNSKNNIHVKILEYDAIQILKKLPFEINSMIEDYAIDYEIEKGRKIHKKKQINLNVDIKNFFIEEKNEKFITYYFTRINIDIEDNDEEIDYLFGRGMIRLCNFWKIREYLIFDFLKNEVPGEKNHDEFSNYYRSYLLYMEDDEIYF